MIKRYAVVFSKLRGHTWMPTTRRRCRSLVAAERLAQRIGDRHPDLRVTRAHYHRRRSTVEVVDLEGARGGRTVWEHPGVIVPSVGELGYW